MWGVGQVACMLILPPCQASWVPAFDDTTHVPTSAASAEVHSDIASVLLTEQQITDKTAELAARVRADYSAVGRVDRPILLVGVLKGAVMFMADFARALNREIEMEFMAISSYGASTSSSGVVRILKDLDRDITDKHVLLVEDVVDSGLTLSWLLRNLASRGPASLEVVALLRKPDAIRVPVDVRYVGFDIPNEFVVGYGLDYAERYRNLPYLGKLKPQVYSKSDSSWKS